jgi:hypothetical protein
MFGTFARLIHAETLDALGQRSAAREAIAAAKKALLGAARRIADEAQRRAYLTQVWANARTLELADAWLGSSAA